MGGVPLDSRMERRIGLALCVCAVLPVVAFALIAGSHAWLALAAVLLIALAGAVFTSLYLRRSYVPALQLLTTALGSLRAREFGVLAVPAIDEPRQAVEAFNRSVVSLDEQFRALETLAEIDQLLLQSAELERVLDAIMSRVQALTHCQSVGITLRATRMLPVVAACISWRAV